MRDANGALGRPTGFGKIKVHTKSGRIGRVVGAINSPRIMLRLRFASGVEESFSWGALQPPTKDQALKFERTEVSPIMRPAGNSTPRPLLALAAPAA